jgi:hypothetical protein
MVFLFKSDMKIQQDDLRNLFLYICDLKKTKTISLEDFKDVMLDKII